jgi:tRNA (cytidine/uridine-2'-O-)-methyltransferase
VRPLGFTLEDRQLRRAGLDYRDMAEVVVHESLEDCLAGLGGRRLFALSTRGSVCYARVDYAAGDVFLLGAETDGLPAAVLELVRREHRLRIPMRPRNRSVNLSNAAAVLVYEAWRQLGFAAGA